MREPIRTTVSGLLKKTHLRPPILRMGTRHARALAAPFDGLRASGSRDAWTHLRRVPPAFGVPPCPSTALGILSLSKDIWTFLSSLGENRFFSSLLEERPWTRVRGTIDAG